MPDPLSSNSSSIQPTTCPTCGAQSFPDLNKEEWQAIGQLHSLAEAGYLESKLNDADIPVVLQHQEQFDAASGAWSQYLIVHVPASQKSKAIEILATDSSEDELKLSPSVENTSRGEIHSAQAESFQDNWQTDSQHTSQHEFDAFETPNSSWSNTFIPLICLGLFSLICYWGYQQVALMGINTNQPTSVLWKLLTSSDQPEGKRTIVFDSETNTIEIQDDTDADGKADRWFEFKNERLVEEN